jgi:hypothetical protein
MKESIMQPWPYVGRIPNDARCWFCHSPAQCRHHVYPGNPNRKVSEREGCWVYLCDSCHRMVHAHVPVEQSGRGMVDSMRLLQETCQVQWMHANRKTEDDFRKRFGKSYIPF